jgi:hypothetical protein
MEGPAITIIIVIIIGVILAVIVIASLLHAPAATKSTTTLSNISPTTTLVPVVVNFYTVNLEYVYTGPAKVNNVTCGYRTYEYTSSQSDRLNGSETFYLQYSESSSGCPMSIYNVTVDTPGFAISSTVPYLPLSIPVSSTAQLQLNMRTPQQNFYGPLSITIYYN